MKLLSSLIVFIFCFSVLAEKLPMPKKNPKIPAAMMRTLKSNYSDFKVLSHLSFSKDVLKIASNHPAKVFGDFNDDGKKDGVFYGYSKKQKKIMILAVVSEKSKKKFKVEIIHQIAFVPNQETTNYGDYLNVGLKNLKQGRKRDVLQWESFGQGPASVEAYYYSKKENKFKPFINKMD